MTTRDLLETLLLSVVAGLLVNYLFKYLTSRNRDRILLRTSYGLLIMLGVAAVSGVIGALVTRAVVSWITGSDIGDLLGLFAGLICATASWPLIEKRMEAIRQEIFERPLVESLSQLVQVARLGLTRFRRGKKKRRFSPMA